MSTVDATERNTRMNRIGTRALAVGGALAALAFIAGCGQDLSAERDGRQLAEAVCDVRDATDAESAEAAIAEVEQQIDDIVREYGVATAEDRADISNNLADLAEHVVQGNEVLIQQDLTVLLRSAENIRDDATEVQQSVWNGIAAGLQECTAD
jgi:hypothetical protein